MFSRPQNRNGQVAAEPRIDRDDAAGVAIEARGITVAVRGKVLVDDVSLRCPAGEVVGIVGPNGAGKTTLLKAMAGLTKPTRGSVKIGGNDLAAMSVGQRSQRVAYAPQIAAIHPFNAIDMVLMGRYPYLNRFQLEDAGDRDVARAALSETDTLEFADRRVDTLSGGERQRVMLARVLAQDTDVILADEPVASLDIKHQLLAMRLLRDRARARGVAVCVIMHDLNLAAMYCDTVVAMRDGRRVAGGAPPDILTAELIREVFQVNARVSRAGRNGSTRLRIELEGAE